MLFFGHNKVFCWIVGLFIMHKENQVTMHFNYRHIALSSTGVPNPLSVAWCLEPECGSGRWASMHVKHHLWKWRVHTCKTIPSPTHHWRLKQAGKVGEHWSSIWNHIEKSIHHMSQKYFQLCSFDNTNVVYSLNNTFTIIVHSQASV